MLDRISQRSIEYLNFIQKNDSVSEFELRICLYDFSKILDIKRKCEFYLSNHKQHFFLYCHIMKLQQLQEDLETSIFF